ncbi:MAG: bifunctional pyr operon transcriptional regulator/uracil phosphoribosyltransferase [Chloroflexi bacterium]|nr:bifunctional pyr operon transcriptional regulator/uracil phosphoribosyltransferase [Chloroflexota bacterium]MBP05874.1 bifunctional pyr operon transcriptional regulator/uracil phosphoribosyltransferase [Chloroflexota bacterium]
MKSLENYKTLLDADDIRRAIARLSHEIIESNQGTKNLILIGIKTRGLHIASRIVNMINTFENTSLDCHSINPQFFRDDIQIKDKVPNIELEVNIHEQNIILIDDVLYTGRTIRATLEAIFTLGRPKTIKLAALVDRGHREIPIRPDFIGKSIPTSNSEHVRVFMKEEDGADKVGLFKERKTNI